MRGRACSRRRTSTENLVQGTFRTADSLVIRNERFYLKENKETSFTYDMHDKYIAPVDSKFRGLRVELIV